MEFSHKPVSFFYRWYHLIVIAMVIVFLFMLAIAGTACYIVSSVTHPGEQSAKFMLPDTDGYVTFNLKPGLSQSLEFKRFLDSFLTDPYIESQLQDLQGQLQNDWDWDIDIEADVMPWLGPELAYGIVNGPDALTYGPEMFVLVGTSDETATEALLQEWLQKRVAIDGITLGGETYQGVEITIVNPADPVECYAVTHGYGLAFFGNVTRLHSTIDLMKDGGPSLWDNADFQSARSNLPEGRMGMGYGDVEHFLGLLGDSIENPADIALFNALRPYGPSYISFSLAFANKGIELHIYSPTAEGWSFAVDSPNPLSVINLLPVDVLGCYADHNLPLWWQEAMDKRDELSLNEEWNDILGESFNVTAIEDMLGFDFEEDVFGWMSGEFAIAALPYWGQGPGGEGPAILALVQFDNQSDVETSLDKIITGINSSGELEILVSYTTIEGIPATMLSLADSPGGEPITQLGYLYLDDFLVAGTSPDALAAVVLAYQQPELSLAQSEKYQRMYALLPDPKTGLVYIDAPQVVNFILSIPEVSSQDKEDYLETINPFIEPLEGMGLSYSIGTDDSTLTLVLHVERVLTNHDPYPNPDSDEQVSVQAQILGGTGIQQADLVWSLDGTPQSELAMYDDGSHGDGSAGDGVFGVQIGPFPAGTKVDYQVRVTDVDADTMTAPAYPTSFQSVEPLSVTSNILLIVDTTDPLAMEYYAPGFQDSLEAISLSYDFWDTSLRGVPEGGELAHYLDGAVIWGATGPMPDGYLVHYLTREQALAALKSYLDAGGALFISGSYVAAQLQSEDFLTDYLHTTFVQDHVGHYSVLGVPGDPISDGLAFPAYTWWADEIDPISPAVTIFTYDDSTTYLASVAEGAKLVDNPGEQYVHEQATTISRVEEEQLTDRVRDYGASQGPQSSYYDGILPDEVSVQDIASSGQGSICGLLPCGRFKVSY